MTATPQTWKLYNSYPATRLESRQLDVFRSRVRELTDGSLSIGIDESNEPGRDDQHALSWLATAGDVVAHLRSSQLQNAHPVLRSAYVMGSARDIRAHMLALPALESVYTEVLRGQGIVPIAFLPSAIFLISVFSQGRPVRSLDALRDRKLRVFSADLEPTFRRLGVDANFIPQPELHDALASGRVDSTIYPACHTVWSVPLWRVTQHAAYLFAETLPPNVLAMSDSRWSALSETEQSAMRCAAREVYPEYLRISLSDTAERSARDSLLAAGVTWHPDFPVADQDAFAASAKETWGEYAAAAGPAGQAARRQVMAAMERGF